jgi:hypothetical protein
MRPFKRHRLTLAALACALLARSVAAKDIDCPSFPDPKAKMQWVAPYMIYNGVPMSVKRFDSEQTPNDILTFYRQLWANANPALAPQEYMTGPWQTIAVMRGKCFYTVQVQSAGKGSTGMVSASQALDKPIASAKPIPMMYGSNVINDIQHVDDGKNARTVLLSNGFSMDANADFYRKSFADQGWKLLSGAQVPTKKGPGITMVMKRDLAEVNLVITRSGQSTMVLATIMDNP